VRMRILAGLMLLLAAVMVVKIGENRKKLPDEIILPTPAVSPSAVNETPPNGNLITVDYGNNSYKILAVRITAGDTLSLIPNFEKQQDAETLAESNICRTAINGGFYREDNSPLGLFYSNGNLLSKQIKSQLVTGFFWQDLNGNRGFGRELPVTVSETDFIMQTGPYIPVGDYRLKLVQDEHARRSMVAKDDKNNFYLISVIDGENSYAGPLLADLPSIFSQPKIQNRISFTELLNLDGGSASFFYDKGAENSVILSSLTPVGSLLCLKTN